MKILFFLSEAARGTFGHLDDIIKDIVPSSCLQVCHNLNDLNRRLRNPWEKCDITILMAANNQELGYFTNFRSLLEDLRLILIIPDRKSQTIRKGHLLAPRYLSYVDSDFQDVAAVLKRMIKFVKKLNVIKEKGDSHV